MTPGRWLWTTAGLILTGIGIIGYILPVMPGTVFLILALFCFQNGSMRMHRWLLSNRLFGPTLRDWDENKWITKRVKIMAISFMWVFGCGSCFSKPNPLIIAASVSLCALGTWYVASRPTKPVRLKVVEAEAETTSRRA
jgi:uncharacterized membrane protein YbaN (DUF454 family)